MKKIIGVFVILFLAVSANAAVINVGDFDAGSVSLNFDELADGTLVNSQYAASGLQISGTLGNDGTGAASNVYAEITGGANSAPVYIGQEANAWNGSVIFSFTGVNVTQFGGVAVDSLGNWLSVYDQFDNLIETVFSDGSVYDFLGVDTGGVNIAYAIFSGAFYAVDDVMFNATASVPEPGTFVLFALGLFGLGVARHRMKQN